MADSFRFDLLGLHAALDAQRRERGITWKHVASEIGVSASTLQRTGAGGHMEADGVRAMVAWLGRSPEDFVRTAPGLSVPAAKRRKPASRGKVRRFDSAALFNALDRERTSLGISWRQMAAALGAHVAPSSLTRLRSGGRLEVGLMVAATGRLGMSVEDLTYEADA
jgi:hypothetical protein